MLQAQTLDTVIAAHAAMLDTITTMCLITDAQLVTDIDALFGIAQRLCATAGAYTNKTEPRPQVRVAGGR